MSKEEKKVESKETGTELDAVLSSIDSKLMTESVKTKLGDLFEAILTKKTIELKEKFEKEHSEKMVTLEKHADAYAKYVAEYLEDKAVDFVDEHFFKEFDKYTTHCADEFMKENKLAIENGVKVEMFDNMVNGLRNVLVENAIPEKTVDVVDYDKKISALKESLEKKEKELMESRRQTQKKEVQQVFEACTADLTLIQKNNLKKIVENYSVDNLTEFKRKLIAAKTVVKESSNVIPSVKAPAIDKSSSVVITEEKSDIVDIEDLEDHSERSEISGNDFVKNITDQF